VVLSATAATLGMLAQHYYDRAHPLTFKSVLASNLLQGAVIVTGAAVITFLLSIIQEMRAKGERDMAKKLELFRRMRAAHVCIVRAQGLLRADARRETYSEQMRALMAVTRDLEEIREEVKVSGHLYRKRDRRSIMGGIALIIIFLGTGSNEYIEWCKRPSWRKGEPRDNKWVAALIKSHKPQVPVPDPFNENWAPPGRMPQDYECGLTKSKGRMREYAYGTRMRKADWRRLVRSPRKGRPSEPSLPHRRSGHLDQGAGANLDSSRS
jgi:hypothetical protein